MGRKRKRIRPTLWHEAVVADFLARHPDGMYRPVDLEVDPGMRIDTMQWWENRAALFLVGCIDPDWDVDRMALWVEALTVAAEARNAVLEVACAVAGGALELNFGRLAPGFKCRRRPDKALGILKLLGGPDRDAEAPPRPDYVHLVRTPPERERPPPLTVAEEIANWS